MVEVAQPDPRTLLGALGAAASVEPSELLCHRLVARLRPWLLLHGHLHPSGQPRGDHDLHGTAVCNLVGHRYLELAPGDTPVADGVGAR